MRFGAGKLKVMLVETAHTYLELERTFLNRQHVAILEGPEDLSLVEKVRRATPRAVVVDVRRPEKVGFELCRALKADPVAGRVPVVLLVEKGDAREGLDAGADGLVAKPIEMREFLDTICRFIHLKERRSPRVPANLRFTWRWDGKTGQAFSRELSAYGVFLKTDLPAPEGAVLELGFYLPGELDEIHCRGVVRLANQDFDEAVEGVQGLGIEFENVEPEDLLRFQSFIDQNSAPGPGL